MLRLSERGKFAGFIQSLSSIGPMLDIVALFSVIAIYSGPFLPVVMLLSFLAGYTSILIVRGFATAYTTNGGYYSFAGISLGKSFGIFTAVIYLVYAFLVLPDISSFVAGFLYSTISMAAGVPIIVEPIIAMTFAGLAVLVVSRGFRLSMKYTIVAGIVEIGSVIGFSALFFYMHSNSLPTLSFTSGAVTMIWTGFVFGILAFSGSGSSVFISDNVKEPKKTIPKSLIISYTFSGIMMLVSSVSVLLFLGSTGFKDYSTTPYFILSYIDGKAGFLLAVIFSAVGTLSAFNLSVAYLNASANSFEKMSHDSLLPSSFQFPDVRKIFLIAVFAVTLLISLISYATSGYFFAFETLAGVVSLSYIMVHMILNAASVKLRKIYGKRIIVISVVSSIFLLSALAYSVAGNILEDPLTDTIMAVVFAGAFIVTLIAALRKDFMLGIKIDSGNEGRAENG